MFGKINAEDAESAEDGLVSQIDLRELCALCVSSIMPKLEWTIGIGSRLTTNQMINRGEFLFALEQ